MTRVFAHALFRSCLAVTGILFATTCLLGLAPAGFSAQCIDDVMDIHGDPANADLVVFAGGNEWFALPEIFRAFQTMHPEVIHIYYETLPPGIISQQITTGSLQIGGVELSPQPDVLLGGQRGVGAWVKQGRVGTPVTFASNVLGIMVRAGNPKHVRTL